MHENGPCPASSNPGGSLSGHTRPRARPQLSRIWLGAGLVEELDPVIEHAAIGGVEFVDAEEQADASGELSSNRCSLAFTIGPSEEQTGNSARRPNHDPSLRASVAGERWRILDEFEAQRLYVEADGAVVIVDDDGRVLDVHPSNVDDRSERQQYTSERGIPGDTGPSGRS